MPSDPTERVEIPKELGSVDGGKSGDLRGALGGADRLLGLVVSVVDLEPGLDLEAAVDRIERSVQEKPTPRA